MGASENTTEKDMCQAYWIVKLLCDPHVKLIKD